jgi:flagellar assembly protein FliH
LELQARVEEALEVINQAVKEREKIIKDAESEILRLSLKIAEQIIRSEVSLHRDVCLNIVSEAIQRVSDREQVIIRVNREDLEQVKKYKDRIAGLVDGVKSFSILEDSHVEPGGCMIETNLGFVDARISTKLAAIEEAFKRAEKEE